VKVGTALQAVSRLFIDTAPVVYYIERNPIYAAVADDIFDRIDAGTLQGVTSPVTLAECLIVPIRLALTQIQHDFTDLLVHGANMVFVPLDAGIAGRTAELRAKYNLGLSDAFQVAAALAAGCQAFLTNDHGFKRVQELPILILADLEV
jgi:predicted nucleic acid-binding protein